MPEIFTTRQIPKVMFANCGHNQYRSLIDCTNLGFISAGQGRIHHQNPYYFSNQIRRLIVGDILAVYRNKVGYVGIAKVISEPTTISNAIFNGELATPELFRANMFNDADDPQYAECL